MVLGVDDARLEEKDMKAQIQITDEHGRIYHGTCDLVQVRERELPVEAVRRRGSPAEGPDFTKPERAFFKTYAMGLSGAKKFVLVVAYLGKGHEGCEVALVDVKSRWNRMTSLLGEFNGYFTNAAKEQGWVDGRKKGM